jgi:hypothetical protein
MIAAQPAQPPRRAPGTDPPPPGCCRHQWRAGQAHARQAGHLQLNHMQGPPCVGRDSLIPRHARSQCYAASCTPHPPHSGRAIRQPPEHLSVTTGPHVRSSVSITSGPSAAAVVFRVGMNPAAAGPRACPAGVFRAGMRGMLTHIACSLAAHIALPGQARLSQQMRRSHTSHALMFWTCCADCGGARRTRSAVRAALGIH